MEKKLQDKTLLAAAAALAIAIGVVGVAVNSSKYTDAVVEARRDAGVTADEVVDLLETKHGGLGFGPGETVTSTVNTWFGARPTSVSLWGEAVGRWTVAKLEYRDRPAQSLKTPDGPDVVTPGSTIVRVTATRDLTPGDVRFVALLSLDNTSVSAIETIDLGTKAVPKLDAGP